MRNSQAATPSVILSGAKNPESLPARLRRLGQNVLGFFAPLRMTDGARVLPGRAAVMQRFSRRGKSLVAAWPPPLLGAHDGHPRGTPLPSNQRAFTNRLLLYGATVWAVREPPIQRLPTGHFHSADRAGRSHAPLRLPRLRKSPLASPPRTCDPQQATEPSAFNPQVCRYPALTEANYPAGGVAWP